MAKHKLIRSGNHNQVVSFAATCAFIRSLFLPSPTTTAAAVAKAASASATSLATTNENVLN